MESRNLPHSKESERGVLACCLLDPVEFISECLDQKINESSFYLNSHKILWSQISKTYSIKGIIDSMVLCEELKSAGTLEEVGGPLMVAEVASYVETTAHGKFFIEKILELEVRRGLVAAGIDIIEDSYDEANDLGSSELIEKSERKLWNIAKEKAAAAVGSVEGVNRFLKRLDESTGQQDGLIGMSTGFPTLDKLTGGLQKGHLVAIAAAPKTGKTALAMRFIEAILFSQESSTGGSLIFSLEMSVEECIERLVFQRGFIDGKRLRDNLESNEAKIRLGASLLDVKGSSFYIVDDSDLTIGRIRSKARRHVMRHPETNVIIVDHLLLLQKTDPKQSKNDSCEEISKECKHMAKELNVCVIILCQLNKAPRREKVKPTAADIKFGAGIEADCNKLLLLHCHDDQTDIVIEYQRDGQSGAVIETDWKSWCVRFDEKGTYDQHFEEFNKSSLQSLTDKNII